MLQPNLLVGCNTLNSNQTIAKVDDFVAWMDFENSKKDKNVPAVFIVEMFDDTSIHYLMDYLPYSLSCPAHMTIRNYFIDICGYYDQIDFLKGTNYGYHCYSTRGVIDRVHPDDVNEISQSIYDIVMDVRNWWR